jgi:hypothetical protein
MNEEIEEKALYNPIKDCFLRKFQNAGFSEVHLEITSGGNFSSMLREILKAEMAFLSRRFAPDLTGYIREKNRMAIISIEVKRKEVGFSEIFQAKGYGELLRAKFAFLVSHKSLSPAVRQFLRERESILYYGYPNVKVVYIGRFNIETKSMVEEDWYPKSPFS